MFESVAPETFQRRSRRLFYETLPLSIVLHLLVIAAAVTGAVWNVAFPEQTPRIVRAYFLSSVPEPPPPPPLPPTSAPDPRPTAPPPPALTMLAPTRIPDLIATVAPPPAPVPAPVVTQAVPGGDPAGQIGGEIGGKLHGVPGGMLFPDDGRVHIQRNVQLPLVAVSQEYPKYPEDAKRAQLEDQVIIRYIIGKDGKVISVEILDHASFPSFDESVLKAIREWRFRPMIKDGKPTEVVHELAVNFELVRH